MKLRKVLFIVLGVVVIAGIAVFIWWLAQRLSTSKEQKAIRNINVAALKTDSEKAIGVIDYPGAKVITPAAKVGTNETAVYETTDSMDGAVGIYYQDILNRYKSYEVDKKTITKDDALGKKATVITCSGQTGTLTVTIWPETNGMTKIEVVKTSDFK